MTQPVSSAKTIPPNPDPMLASPQIEATTFFGKTSAGKASMLATQAVYPNIARDTSPMDIVGL